LYWVSDIKPPQKFKNAFFFNFDEITCLEVNKDFTPESIGVIHRYCYYLEGILKSKSYRDHKIFHYSSG
jgi:hypothetical protein